MSLSLTQSVLDYVVVLLLSTLVGLLGGALILAWRWLRAQELSGWALVAVNAAEQIWKDTGTGEQKLQYAMGLLTRVFPKLDTDLARALIETAVRELPSYKDPIVVGDEGPAGGSMDGPQAVARQWVEMVDKVERVPTGCRYGFRIETHEARV